MAVKISELANLSSPTANTIVFALDNQLNPNTSYQLKLSTIRSFVTSSSYVHANSAFDKANSANVHANSAYTLANTANLVAYSAFANSNSVYILASSAFANGNSTYIYANSAYDTTNSSFIKANTSFDKANSANVHANSAYTHANSGYGYANSAYNLASSAYSYAEVANTTAAFAAGLAGSANINSILAVSTATNAISDAANSQSTADAAYTQANTAYNFVISNIASTNAAFIQANTANTLLDQYITTNPVINVLRYGAASNGTSNSTNGIQAAINDGVGRVVYIPPGTYLCDNLTLYSRTTIVGTGNDTVILANSNNISLFSFYATEGVDGNDIRLNNIRISTNDKSNCSAVVVVGNPFSNYCSGINIENVNIYSSNTVFTTGILLNHCNHSSIKDNIFNGCNTDVIIESSTKIRIKDNSFESNVSNNLIETLGSDYNMLYGNITFGSLVKEGANTLSVNNIENAGI